MFAIQATKLVFSKKSMGKENKIKFGIPFGHIFDTTKKLFEMAKYNLFLDEQIQMVKIDDPEIECLFTRPIEIAPFVEKGLLDAGIVTKAAILETKVKVIEVCNLNYSQCFSVPTRIVIAVPTTSKIKSLKDLSGRKIVTRVPEITKEFLKKNKISAKISSTNIGITPTYFQKVPAIADAVVEFISSGGTLKMYNFKILEEIMENPAILIANKISLKNKWKREKIEGLGYLLKGARIAQKMAGLMLHAPNEILAEVLKILPALKKPTVTQLRGENWFDVLTVANKKEIRELIPKLKKIGCTDIIEFPLSKVVI